MSQQEYWARYYEGIHSGPNHWLDYSNGRVQAQTFANALEALGNVEGLTCLDVGAGRGQFALALHGLGAKVTAIELISATVERLIHDHPEVRWRAGDVSDPVALGSDLYDRVTALEVLQYVPFAATLRLLWDRVTAGGRLVGVIPNSDCPLAGRAAERYQGNFTAASYSDIATTLAALPSLSSFRYRGLTFGDDQSLVPYQTSAWTTETTWTKPPNRWVFVALKSDAP